MSLAEFPPNVLITVSKLINIITDSRFILYVLPLNYQNALSRYILLTPVRTKLISVYARCKLYNLLNMLIGTMEALMDKAVMIPLGVLQVAELSMCNTMEIESDLSGT